MPRQPVRYVSCLPAIERRTRRTRLAPDNRAHNALLRTNVHPANAAPRCSPAVGAPTPPPARPTIGDTVRAG
ncbi:hypothetical protein ABT297_42505 [Dactylosporangium sp. NPDC000555]|uniref:hypothetical protein n=1 Tax=Dactylosporangium sp. NPDC000555 TaxID=3154260 RepID=UPI003319DC0E